MNVTACLRPKLSLGHQLLESRKIVIYRSCISVKKKNEEGEEIPQICCDVTSRAISSLLPEIRISLPETKGFLREDRMCIGMRERERG